MDRPNDAQYLALLRTQWKRHNAFPSMAKLCDVLGLSSTASVFGVVSRLTEAGYLERVESRIAPTKRFFARPVLGWVCSLVKALRMELSTKRLRSIGPGIRSPNASMTASANVDVLTSSG